MSKQEKSTTENKKISFNLNKVTKEEYEQLQDERTPPPKLNIVFADVKKIILSGLIIVGVFFGAGGIWAAVAEISGAVIAQGEVRVDAERKTVQHLEGGIVRQILVRNGDHVEAGQPLVLLERSLIMANVEQIAIRIAATKLAIARMEAERDSLDEPHWPSPSSDVASEDFLELKQSEEKVFRSRRQSQKEEIGLLNKQIEQMNEQVYGYLERINAEEQIIAAVQEELTAKEALLEEKFIDKTAVLSLRRTLAEHIGEKGQLRGAIAETRERMAEYELRIDAVQTKKREEVIANLATARQQFFELQQQLTPQLDARKRLSVVAPVSGEVVAMQIHSVGGVVNPGQPLLDIVPDDNPLIIECKIMVKDITHVNRGQDADVQLLAFNQRTTPKITGKVVYISADRLMQQTAFGDQPTYVVHVELDKTDLFTNDLYLTAGMPAAVFIRTEPRTVLDYLIEPLVSNFDRALREN